MTFLYSAIRWLRQFYFISERVESYVSGVNMTRTVTSAIPLLNLQHDDETKPLLPLSSDDPLAFENSPLASVRRSRANASDVVSELLGPGPWPLRAVLQLPADCGLLHPTSRSGDSSIHVTHVLRFTMRLARGDDAALDSKTNKRKLFEVVVRTPVHILSVRCPLFISSDPTLTYRVSPHGQCYARAEYIALPRYSETLDDSAVLTPRAPSCPCAAERKRRSRVGDRSRVEASPVMPTPFGEDPNELLERTLAYERLVSGHESVLGDAPPAYDAASAHQHHHAPHASVISV
jgi:arrestin-related trafficking adapter 3/6